MLLFPNIKNYSSKKNITFLDLLNFFIDLVPFIVLVLIISSVLAYINFFINKNDLEKKGELNYLNFAINNFTVLNNNDSYFFDVNETIKKPINVIPLLRKLSLNQALINSEFSKTHKVREQFSFLNTSSLGNSTDIVFSVYVNEDSDQNNKFKEYIKKYLFDFTFNELERLFTYKINQAKIQIANLEEISNKSLKETEKISLDLYYKNLKMHEEIFYERLKKHEEIKQRVRLTNEKIKNQIVNKKFDFLVKLFNNMSNEEVEEFLNKNDFFSLDNFLSTYLDDAVKGDFDQSLFYNYNNERFITQDMPPLLQVNTNPIIENNINEKSSEIEILQNYKDKIINNDENLIYYNNFTVTKVSNVSLIELFINYSIILILISILFPYFLFLIFHIKNHSLKTI